MKDENKLFLVVWIPIFLFVSMGIFGAIGRTVVSSRVSDEGVVGVDEHKQTLGDVLVPFAVLVFLSIIVFVIVNLGWDKGSLKEVE